jgi:hypothetical protein
MQIHHSKSNGFIEKQLNLVVKFYSDSETADKSTFYQLLSFCEPGATRTQTGSGEVCLTPFEGQRNRIGSKGLDKGSDFSFSANRKRDVSWW